MDPRQCKFSTKWQFKLPLTKGESYVPITSISDRNYQTYLSGKRELSPMVFYGKQLKIDRTAKYSSR